MLRNFFSKSFTYLFILISLCTSACQTLNEDAPEKKALEILTTQKTMAVNYINQGQPNLALKELRPLEKSNPKDSDIKNLLGLTYLAMQNSKVAQTYFEKAYALNKRAPIALNLSSAMIENGQGEKAIQLLKDLQASEAGKSYQFPERIHHNIGLAAERLKKTSLAEKHYKHALEENPYSYITLMRLGAVYESIRKNGYAYQSYVKASEACLKCFDPVNASVKLQMRAGKPQLAVKTLQNYLENKELDTSDRMKAQKLMSTASRSVQQAKGNKAPKPARR